MQLWISIFIFHIGTLLVAKPLPDLGPQFIAWPLYSSCLLRRISSGAIRLCIQGHGDHRRAEEMARESVSLWMEPLYPYEKASAVTVTFDCDRADGTVFVSPGSGQEFWSNGSIYVFDHSAFGTYLHEFGHALACLGDTYVNQTAGLCMPAEPHSVMCDGLLRKDLSEDDVSGIRYQFRSLKSG